MCRLVRTDYAGLAGRTVSTLRWSQDTQSLHIEFADGSRAVFRFKVTVEDDLSLAPAKPVAPVLAWKRNGTPTKA